MQLQKYASLKTLKFRCFKYISDKADENANIDWKKNLRKELKLSQILLIININ